MRKAPLSRNRLKKMKRHLVSALAVASGIYGSDRRDTGNKCESRKQRRKCRKC